MKYFACAIGLMAALVTASALAQTAETSPQSDRGKALTEAKCSTCHGMGRVFAYKRTRAQWSDTVDSMMEKGLEASDSEIREIVDYLAITLPPAPDPEVATSSRQGP